MAYNIDNPLVEMRHVREETSAIASQPLSIPVKVSFPAPLIFHRSLILQITSFFIYPRICEFFIIKIFANNV